MRTTDTEGTRSRRWQYLPAALVLALTVGCASTMQNPTQYTAPEGVTILSEEELHSKIVNNSVSGVLTAGDKWAEFYASDGAIRGENNGEPYTGSWQITGPVMCFDYAGTQYDGCNTIEVTGDKVRFFELDGGPSSLYPTGMLAQGNPSGF